MQRKLPYHVLVSLLISTTVSNGQPRPITWNYELLRTHAQEWVIKIDVSLAPGWYIYSQHNAEGGPIPTLIKEHPNDEYVFVGSAIEKGKVITFYDSLYQMMISRYHGNVTLLQRVSMSDGVPEIKGQIECLVCSDNQCIPLVEMFTIRVKP